MGTQGNYLYRPGYLEPAGQSDWALFDAGLAAADSELTNLNNIITQGPTFLGYLTSDPDTSNWGSAQEGKFEWWNKTDHHKKGWNGSEIIIIG